MAITAVSRWKGNQEETSRIAREIAPILKRHGAVSVRWGPCHAGAYAGQMFAAIAFQDWATYVSTPERNCIGGRSKNASRAEAEGWPCSAQ